MLGRIPSVDETGSFVNEGMLQANAVQKSALENAAQRLKNQYYAPDILSQIANRNALTQGQTITNQYLPDQLRLANALAGLNVQYYVPKLQSEMNLQRAQAGLYGSEAAKTNYMLQHPGLMAGGEAATLQGLKDMGLLNQNVASAQPQQGAPMGVPGQPAPMNSLQSGGQSPAYAPFNTSNPTVNAILNRPFAQAAYQQKMAQGFNWVHSPVDAKDYQIAQLAGAGVDPSESVSLLTQGQTVPQILQQKGYDPNNAPQPDFLPTKGNITQLKKRQAALREMDTISDFVTNGLGPYSQTVFGLSVPQVAGALGGMDDDKQANFLAARGLAPELSNLRLMVAQARTGKYAMQSMIDKSMTNVNAFRSLVTPKVWMKSQKLMGDVLTDAFQNSEKAYMVGKQNQDMGNVGQGAKLLAKGLQFPSFPKGDEGKKQFQAWFKRQPEVTKDAVRIYLQEQANAR